ncbi:MAG: hypothetical protein CMH57_10350 [Myxococcales bacterium]|nr:hypothetical protein [Myxococcales bacterium]
MTNHLTAPRLTLALALVTLASGLSLEAAATPIYAIRAGNACDTCHMEPSGWANPDLKDRLCSMDCNGCHVNPSGGGMRTSLGLHYGRQVLPTWGERPSEHYDPEKYRPEGHPKKGRYRITEGFSGWWPGDTPFKTIDERYGDVDPDPSFRVGGDFRFMNLYNITDDEAAFFPMQADVYLMGKPLDKVTMYASAGLRGYKERPDDLEAIDYFISREAFIKAGQFDYNSYVRAGRFNPSYGWRLPNHTAYTRRDLGFGENRQVFGMEAGINPNYLYANVAGFAQGLEGWPGDDEPFGYGSTFNVGWRDLGWQVGGSLHYLNRLEDGNDNDDVTTGVNWGFNLYPAVYLGEVDARFTLTDGENVTSLFAYHELNWLVLRGWSLKGSYEWQDQNIDILDDHSHRVSLGGDWHPYTYTHIEALYRRTWAGGAYPITELTDAQADEVLAILHAWF